MKAEIVSTHNPFCILSYVAIAEQGAERMFEVVDRLWE
jgi:hypothetical protein